MSTIVYIGGDKGGVGKSMVAIALSDYVKHALGAPVLLIEKDPVNPDAAKCLEHEIDGVLMADTAAPEGLRDLLNAIEAHGESRTVINAGARDNRAMEKFGAYLVSGAAALDATLAAGWVINAERDSLLALRRFLEIFPGKIWVIGNQFFDESGEFSIYMGSSVRAEIEKRGGSLLVFPVLPHLLAAAIRNDRLSPSAQRKNGALFERISLEHWRAGAADVFRTMLG